MATAEISDCAEQADTKHETSQILVILFSSMTHVRRKSAVVHECTSHMSDESLQLFMNARLTKQQRMQQKAECGVVTLHASTADKPAYPSMSPI